MTLATTFALFVEPVFAQESVPVHGTVISSGCEYDYPPFCIVEEDGRANGFSVELLRAALQAMEHDVTFRVGPWAELKTLLELGEIDALPLVGRTPERESLFDFTFPYLSLHGAIVVAEDTTDIHDLKDLKGRRVAVMKGDNAEEFVRRGDLEIEVHTTPTFEDALRELSEGRHDAVVIQRLLALRIIQQSGFTNLRIVGNPLTELKQDFCFAVKEGDRETLEELNEGLAVVMADGTFSRLQSKWFAALELPSDTRIVVGTELDYPPYSFLDKNGNPNGYNVDLTRTIAEVMGRDIEVRIGPWSEIRHALETGEIDAIAGMFYSVERDKQVDFSQPYSIIHHAIFVRRDSPAIETEDDLRGKDIIVMRGDIMHDYVLENGLSEDPVLADSQAEALRLLASGEHDCALVARLSGLYWAKELELSNLVTTGPLLRASDYSFAVPEGHAALRELLGEGLATLEETGAHKAIHDKWLGVLESQGVSPSTIFKYVALVVVPFLVLLAFFVLWSWALKVQVVSRTRDLAESEQRLRSYFNSPIVGIAITSPEKGWLETNPRLCAMLGYSTEELLGGLNWADLTHPDDLAADVAEFERLLAGEMDDYSIEKRFIRKNGEIIWTRLGVGGVRKSDGSIDYAVAILENITERKQAEEERVRLMAAIEQVAESIVITDAEGSIRYVNPFFEQATGYTRKEAIGQNPRILSSGEHDDAFYKDMWDTLTRGDVWTGRMANKKKDGTLFTEDATISPVRNLFGDIDNYVAVKRDVTHEISLTAQLRQSQKMEAVGQLAGGIAHDFNNLLQAILGYGYLALREVGEDRPAHVFIEEMTRAGERATTLVGQLLAFSRRQVLEMKDVNLNDSIADVLKMLHRVIGEHITLEVIRCHDLGIVRADPGQIDQILMNLCVNARDAMGKSGKITIETENVRIDDEFCEVCTWARPGRYVLLSVTDTGCGMDQETLGKVFEPFFTTKDVGKGTGLGLATVYGVIRQHEGLVHVYSEVGQGTTFKIYLPLAERSTPFVGNKIEGPVPDGTESL